MNRRAFTAAAFALTAMTTVMLAQTTSAAGSNDVDPEWLAYLARYVAENGRIVDTANRGISHSEGQGYGMLLAVAHDDRQRFDQMWSWTRRHLQVREDRLFGWKWDPLLRGGQVSDLNNASDGDLLIVWALLEGAELWNDKALALAAEMVLVDIDAKLLVDSRLGPMLLPGAHGFQREAGIVVNPSYWVFPALERIASLTGQTRWQEVVESGHALLREARFGDHDLPPDWVELRDEEIIFADGFTPEFGYNAVRVPLYLAWSDSTAPDLLQPFVDYAAAFDGLHDMPATVDLETGFTSQYRISRGVQAIYQRVREAAGLSPTGLPRLDPREEYYTATLLLLSKRPYEEFSQ